MAYALIPDGYTLEKVTKDQKQAVNEKRRHDNVTALLSNENTPLLLGAGGLVFFTPIIIKLFLKFAEEQGDITPEQSLKLSLLFPAGQILSGAEKLFPGVIRLDDIINFFNRERPDEPPSSPGPGV